MESRHEEFIRQNAGKLSPRQIAKATGLSRTEVERHLAGSKKSRGAAAASTAAPRPLSGAARFLLPLGLFLAALAFKLVFARLFSDTPFFEPLSSTTPKKMDDGLYDQMAVSILGGNWIGDFPLGPYRLPGYAYFLAGVYKVFGHSIGAVHFLQAALGALSVLWVYLLTREIFKDDRAALIAGVLALFYAPLSYFENFLLGETIAIAITLAAVLLAVKAVRGPRPALLLAPAGLLLGVSALFRPNVLLPVALLAVFCVWELGARKKRWIGGLAAAVVFSLACALPLVPLTVRNLKLYQDFVPVSAIGGVNFYLGNNASASGTFTETQGLSGNLDDILHESIEQAETASGRPLKASEVSAYWANKATEFLVANPGPAIGIFRLKLTTLLNNAEVPDILDMNFVQKFLPLLQVLRFAGFGLIFLLALFAWPRLRAAGTGAALLGTFTAGYAFSVLAIFVTSRYRLPLVPLLAVFAGAGASAVWDLARGGRIVPLAVTAALAAFAAIFVYRPFGSEYNSTNFDRLAIYYQYKGDAANAEKYFLKAIESGPNDPYPYNNYAVLLQQEGREEESDRMSEKSQELLMKTGLYNRFISSGSDTQ